ncbi:uncharacterized protein LOC144438965 isoform X2 [Glandiceps talaboti]
MAIFPCQSARRLNIHVTVLYILLSSCLQGVKCTPHSDCVNSKDMYWDQDEDECKTCKTCKPGFGLNMPCGNGQGKRAKCVECAAGFYSDSVGYEQCIPCTTCKHAKVHRECTTIVNRVCGECVHGYNEDSSGTCKECDENEEKCAQYMMNHSSNLTNLLLTIQPLRKVPVRQNDGDSSKNDNNNETTNNQADKVMVAAVILPIIATCLLIMLLIVMAYINLKKRSRMTCHRRSDRPDEDVSPEEKGCTDNETGQQGPTEQMSADNTAYDGTPDTRRKADNGATPESSKEEVDVEAGEKDQFLTDSDVTSDEQIKDMSTNRSSEREDNNPKGISEREHLLSDNVPEQTSVDIIHEIDSTITTNIKNDSTDGITVSDDDTVAERKDEDTDVKDNTTSSDDVTTSSGDVTTSSDDATSVSDDQKQVQ